MIPLISITGGGFKNVLVIGGDTLSRYVDWTDRGTCILFGDAAGAVLVQVMVSVLPSLFNLCFCISNYSSLSHMLFCSLIFLIMLTAASMSI